MGHHLSNARDVLRQLKELILRRSVVGSPRVLHDKLLQRLRVSYPPTRSRSTAYGVPVRRNLVHDRIRLWLSAWTSGGERPLGLPTVDDGPLDAVVKA